MNNLRYLRKQKKVTQQEVADYIGSSSQAYSRFEKGIFKPDAMKIKKLAEYFEVTEDYILSQFPEVIDINERRRMEESLFKKYARQFMKSNTLNYFHTITVYKCIPENFDFKKPDNTLINENIHKVDLPFYYQEKDKPLFSFKYKEDTMSPMLIPDDIVIARREFRIKDKDLVVVNINKEDAVVREIRKIDNKYFIFSLNEINEPIEFVPNQNLKFLGIVIEIKRIIVPLYYLGYIEEDKSVLKLK